MTDLMLSGGSRRYERFTASIGLRLLPEYIGRYARATPLASTTTRPGSIDRTTRSPNCPPTLATTGLATPGSTKIARSPNGPVTTPANLRTSLLFRSASPAARSGRRLSRISGRSREVATHASTGSFGERVGSTVMRLTGVGYPGVSSAEYDEAFWIS